MLILIKPFLYLLAFGQTAVLFAGVFGLACLFLMTCEGAIPKPLCHLCIEALRITLRGPYSCLSCCELN
jgi:hypothetical protein